MNPKPKTRVSLFQLRFRHSGFTLVEMLVVIAIIASLAAITIPVAKGFGQKAANSQCLDRLRNWGNAIGMYAAENAGKVECRNWNSIGRELPSAYVGYWSGDGTHESGYRELGKMRCCPALKGAAAVSGNGNSLTAYSMTDASGIASNNTKASQYSLYSLKSPGQFVMMIETTGGASFIRTPADYKDRVKPLTTTASARHTGNTVNALFGDFSVRALGWKDIEKNVTLWTTF